MQNHARLVLVIFLTVLSVIAGGAYFFMHDEPALVFAVLQASALIIGPLIIYTLWGMLWLCLFRWVLFKGLHACTMAAKHWVLYWAFLYFTCFIILIPYMIDTPIENIPFTIPLVDWNAVFSSLSLGWIFFAPVVVALSSLTLSIKNLGAARKNDN